MTSDATIEVVAATRRNAEQFWTKAPLGLSLTRLSFDTRISHEIAFDNQRGLPTIYNLRIQAPSGHDVLMFIHDDVWLDDFFLADHVIQGLKKYDIIGVAGNRRRLPNQPGWAFVDDAFTWDSTLQLSGSVAHGPGPFGAVSYFGPVPADCELLDGVLLAAQKSKLVEASMSFDTRFMFHFSTWTSAGQHAKEGCD